MGRRQHDEQTDQAHDLISRRSRIERARSEITWATLCIPSIAESA